MSGSMRGLKDERQAHNAVVGEDLVYITDSGEEAVITRGTHVWVDTSDNTLRLPNGDWLDVLESQYELES